MPTPGLCREESRILSLRSPVIARCLLASAIKRQSRLTGHLQNLCKSAVDVWKSGAELQSLNATRESKIAGIWEAKMAILASSSLKRSRALPNCSREDRIRDGPFKCQG